MWHKAKKDDQNLILEYLKAEPALNTFLIADIENFGVDSQFQDIWYEMTEGKPIGVVLRYHQTLICYDKYNSSNFEILDEVLNCFTIDLIQGKASVIKAISHLGKVIHLPFMSLNQTPTFILNKDIKVANQMDAFEIAKSYENYPKVKALYSSDLSKRAEQIQHRISTGEGCHVFVKSKGEILAHGNTTAENSVSAMIGGLFADEEHLKLKKDILSFLSNYLLNKGLKPCLFASDETMLPILYELGYETMEDWGIIRRT